MATSTPSTTQPTLPPHATFHNYGRILRSTQGPPIQAKTHALLESLSELFPTRHHDIDPCFHDDNWYLYALGGLIGTGHAENVGDLYTYLIETGKYGTEGSVERKKMVRRLREGLVKLVILCGIPNVMVGVASLAKVLKEGDRVESTTRVGWQVGEGNEAKGRETIERLYGADSRGVSESFKSFQDFGEEPFSTYCCGM